MAKILQIVVSNAQFVQAIESDRFKTHRDFIAQLFEGRGFVVINFNELKYFYRKDYVTIEGNVGLSIMSK